MRWRENATANINPKFHKILHVQFEFTFGTSAVALPVHDYLDEMKLEII